MQTILTDDTATDQRPRDVLLDSCDQLMAARRRLLDEGDAEHALLVEGLVGQLWSIRLGEQDR